MAVTQSLSSLILDHWPVLSTALILSLAAVVVPHILQRFQLWRIPFVGEELGGTEKRRQAYLAGARRLYTDGYRKFKDGVFRITTSRNSSIVVLSPTFLPELKKLPDTTVSMAAAVDETMETKYTRIDTVVPIIPHTIKATLTPSLARLNPTIAQEVREALAIEMPSGKDWTEINIHHTLLRVIGMVSGRLFIGPELCRTEQYLDAAINYTMEVMEAQRAVQRLRPWLRPFIAHRLPQLKKLDQRIKEADAFLKPVVERRMEAALDPSFEKPDDMLQWLLDTQSKFPDKNSRNMAKVQMGLGFAAIHTTTLTTTNAFYDLAALPELAAELREEAQTALAENNGVFTSNALQSMKKMDSFLKEVLRLHPASMASFQRKVLQPFTLSNGQVIPAGVTIEVPAVAVNSDSEVFPKANEMDPLRFYRLRQDAKASGSVEGSALNQFVSVSQNSLTFGYGRHACPGRFFAANEIKMILANFLMRYEVKNVEGSTERYPNMEFAHMSIPDPSKKVLFREI
ncbi:cytochrome P450 [Dactylonectria estremocensis]|uniref:Cytochrome P450 n=1 Tax=Dactylonectria estremocensis TaxID=1079267 RepID=A0A9P9ERJ2_9HYPO|nr:cytochrome P450 [Dactylonectria estremocensis]